MKRKGRLIFSMVCVLIIMLSIFSFSSQGGTSSSQLSMKVSGVICSVVFSRYEKFTEKQQSFVVKEMHYFIRKLAHFAIYMILGMFTYAALVPYKEELKKPALISLIICGVYAVSDEIHQYYIPGREMRVTDMLLDTFGSLIGIIIVYVIIIVFSYIKDNWKKGA